MEWGRKKARQRLKLGAAPARRPVLCVPKETKRGGASRSLPLFVMTLGGKRLGQPLEVQNVGLDARRTGFDDPADFLEVFGMLRAAAGEFVGKLFLALRQIAERLCNALRNRFQFIVSGHDCPQERRSHTTIPCSRMVNKLLNADIEPRLGCARYPQSATPARQT